MTTKDGAKVGVGRPNRERAASQRAYWPVAVSTLFVVALALRVLIAFQLPPWQSPDEPKHFETARTLRDMRGTLWAERRLTQLSDASPVLQGKIIASLARNHYWAYRDQPEPRPLPTSFRDIWGGTAAQLHRHSLYYFATAAALLPFDSTDGIETQLLVVRLISALFSALAVPVTFVAARFAAPGDRFVHWTSASFVALLPMHVAIGGAANNDNLVTLAGALFAWVAIAGIRRGVGLGHVVLVTLAFILAVASKRGALGLAPALAFVGVVWLGRQRGWRGLIVLGTLAAGAAAAAIYLLPNLGAIVVEARKVVGYWLNEPDQIDRLFRVANLKSPETWRLILQHQEMFFKSFFGVFGWFQVPLGEPLYAILKYVCAAAAFGLAAGSAYQIYLGTRRRDSAAWRSLLITGFCVTAALATTVLAEAERLSYYSAGEIPQGRYLFIAITELAVLLAVGLRELLPRRIVGTPVPIVVWTVALVAFDAIVYLEYLRPALLARTF